MGLLLLIEWKNRTIRITMRLLGWEYEYPVPFVVNECSEGCLGMGRDVRVGWI